ncbi:UNVERIFIED_CONTAM: hypothetical protein Sradi_3998100 [Sesamum radiatum]|uniref:Uncharacterized protein n=1 Tax=Sesamum radiatum TaxID=300843 RepID=A0AAW2PK92_SESRA
MASSGNGDDKGSFEGNTSLSSTTGFVLRPLEQAMGNMNAPDPTINPAVLPSVANLLFYKQLIQFIVD